MAAFVNDALAWLRGKNITSHVIAGLVSTLATAYAFDAAFRGVVASIFVDHPKALALIGAGVSMWLRYSRSSSAAGTVAQAQIIALTPNAPTQAAVDAAKTPTKQEGEHDEN